MAADRWTVVTSAMLREATSLIIKPCCGYKCERCDDDPIRDAVSAGISFGIEYARRTIAERIRAELVCCPGEHIDAMQELMGERGGKPMSGLHEFHPICYWGEMGARLAEDAHSQLESPYECSGTHPGECWNPDNPGRDEWGLPKKVEGP